MPTLPTRVDRIICSMPRSGGNMLLELLRDSGVTACGEWPQDLPNGATAALVHLHYVDQITHIPDRAVLLYRRNVLAQAVSWAAAYKTSDWKTGAKTGPIHLDPGEVTSLAGELIAARQDWLDWLSERSVACLPVAYEDMTTDAQVAGRVVRYLGGDPRRVNLSRETKQGTWVNDVYVGGVAAQVDQLLHATGDGLDGRIGRARMSRNYRTRDGKRRDGLA